MDRHDSDNLPPVALDTTAIVAETGTIMRCCVATIDDLGRHNPMMVCSGCKQIIKCFKEEPAYRNFLTFCRSKRRDVTIGRVAGYHTVIFRHYDTRSYR